MTWRWNLVDQASSRCDSAFPLSTTSASGSNWDPGTRTCTSYLMEQRRFQWPDVQADLSCQGPSIKCDSRPGIMVWLSWRDVISLWNLCCAEQRFRRYWAIFELSVTKPCFFPLGPPHSMISLRLWKTHKCHPLGTGSQMSCEVFDLRYTFTPVEMESVSLQRKRLVTVRMWFFISYTMIPLAQTPKTNSPTTGLFSLPTRWNITPYSGNCWAIWRTQSNTFVFHFPSYLQYKQSIKRKSVNTFRYSVSASSGLMWTWLACNLGNSSLIVGRASFSSILLET